MDGARIRGAGDFEATWRRFHEFVAQRSRWRKMRSYHRVEPIRPPPFAASVVAVAVKGVIA